MIKKEKKLAAFPLAIILIVSFLIYFFLGQSFDLNFLSKIIMSLLSPSLFVYAYRKSTSALSLAMLTSIFLFISLGISFSSEYNKDSPIALNIILSDWTIFIISFISTILVIEIYSRIKYQSKFAITLLVIYIILWIILSINVTYFEDWKLENYLTVPFVVILVILFKKFKFSNVSYALIFTFMTLHIIGTHYTYSEVPFGYWMQSFFQMDRNHYDRIVHFTFGLLLAYPMREFLRRVANVKGTWAFYIPIDMVFGLSALYEIIEWLIAVIFGGDLGVAYLGAQGDIWDAQKDMTLAGLGAIIAMLVTFFIILAYNKKGLFEEIKESLRVKQKQPLGEVALGKLSNSQRK